MIYFFTPYSFNPRPLDEIPYCMELLKSGDWAVIMDGDTMFLEPDFEHQIQQHVENHPEAGLFICFASRCHYSIQGMIGVDPFSDSILYHKQVTNDVSAFTGESVEIHRKITGHFMVILKSTWDRIFPCLLKKVHSNQILGVDTQIITTNLEIGMDLRLMKDVYVLHYCCLAEGFDRHERGLVNLKGLEPPTS